MLREKHRQKQRSEQLRKRARAWKLRDPAAYAAARSLGGLTARSRALDRLWSAAKHIEEGIDLGHTNSEIARCLNAFGKLNILGISIRELEKLVDVYELSSRFKGLRDPAGAITWARELMGVSKKLVTPSVVEAVIEKVSGKRITNSKDLRKLRAILPDPVARAHFLSKQGDIDSAMLRLGSPQKKERSGFAGDLDAVIESMKRVPWTELADLKGDRELLQKIDDAKRF